MLMKGFLTAAFTAMVVGCVFFYFKKTKNLKWLTARICINIFVAIFLFVSMIVTLVSYDSEYKWFAFFLFVPIITFFVQFILDCRRYSKLKDDEERRNAAWKKIQQEREMKQLRLALLEQCGMKFFLKYYKTLLRLPVRDIEIDENYTSEEKTERLTAAKSLIEQGFSKYAAQHILDNYADLLTNDEKVTANEILSKQ